MRDQPDLQLEQFGEAGPVVLLVPGAGAPMQFWPSDFCARIAERGFRVVRYCHRDTGLSTHYDAPYGIEVLLDDMLHLLGRLSVQPAHVVGHSMGGYLVQLMAARFPSGMATGTAISSGPTVSADRYRGLEMTFPSDDVWPVLMENVPTGNVEADLPGWMATWRFLNGTRPFGADAAEAYTRSLYIGDSRNWQVAEHHVHAMSTVPDSLADELRQVARPMLVLHGENDPLVPADNGVASARLIPTSRLRILPGAGHMFFHPSIWGEIEAKLLEHLEGKAAL